MARGGRSRDGLRGQWDHDPLVAGEVGAVQRQEVSYAVGLHQGDKAGVVDLNALYPCATTRFLHRG